MRIAYITAGAGGMYCGSCLRDNTLAAALMDAGHDVLLIPAYTPTRTDERNVSSGRVFLGGINIYLQQQSALFRRTPWALDRLWDFPPLLRLTSRWGVSVEPAQQGRLTVSMLRGTQGAQRKEILKLCRFLAEEASPEIVNLPNSLLISLAPAIKAAMRVPVCCTLQGEELFLDGLGEPWRSESIRLIQAHLPFVDGFLAVSDFGARAMSEYLGIEASRIHAAPLGINFDGFAPKREADKDPFTVGYLARVTPEKGLHVLCEAYRRLRSQPDLPASRLWAAGYLSPERRAYLSEIHRRLDSWGLSEHFRYHGELDRPGKLAFLKELSVFSVPGSYDDPKGLSLLEAMAAGVPVVQPRRGAFTEMVEATQGGILVEPDNSDALAAGILELWRNPTRRMELGSRGHEGVRKHYSASRMAERVVGIYQSLIGGQSAVSPESPGTVATRDRSDRPRVMLEVRSLSKEYPTPEGQLQVLSEVSLSLGAGDSASIVGPSGSGKSTLLYILGALEPPTSGTILLSGRNPFELDEKGLAAFRNEKIGFVFQDHHLLPQCTVLENVLIPTLVAEDAGGREPSEALRLLERVGLGPRVHHRPHELSGGEKQRVALVRALIRKPQLVLCDEPTGNLDHESAEKVAALLLELHEIQQTVLIVVTHNTELAARFRLRYRLADTRLHPV